MAEPTLHGNAKHILRIISRIEGEVSTRDITSESGLTNDLVAHHIKTLIGHDYVEKVGIDEEGNTPIPANTYEATPEGEQRAQQIRMELNEQPDVGGDESERIAELEETVETLKRQNEVLFDRLDEVEPVAMENKEFIERARSKKR